jgi:transcriptional regulator with XRE-family HTH domain
MDSKLQQNLVHLRKEAGLTQKELASVLSYSDKVISKWERGESVPNIEAVSIIASYYDVTVDQLLGRDVETNQPDVTNTKKLALLKVKNPSIWRVLFIVPFVSVSGILLFLNQALFWQSMIVLGIAIFIYALLISKGTYEGTLNGLKLRVDNSATCLKAYINDECVIKDRSMFVINPVYEVSHSNIRLRFQVMNVWSMKCNVYLDEEK